MPLGDGRVVIIGDDQDITLKSTLIYDPKSKSFSEGPDMNERREAAAAVKLDDDHILVIGGRSTYIGYGEANASTEILDTKSMTFSAGPSMATRRQRPAAVKLIDGRVLVLGGLNFDNARDEEEVHRTTEWLDVATNTFSPGPSMQVGRMYTAAVQVDDQRHGSHL